MLENSSLAYVAQHTPRGDGHKSPTALTFPSAMDKVSSSTHYVCLQASFVQLESTLHPYMQKNYALPKALLWSPYYCM